MSAPRHEAFTLLELLVVVGLVAFLAGVFGLTFHNGNPASALQSAQGTVASLLAAARGEAALRQTRAMLVVDADAAGVHFLRGIHLAVESSPNSGQWQITGVGAVLPPGICVVPGTGALDGVTFAAAGSASGIWPVRRRSSLELAPAGRLAAGSENPAGKYLTMTAPLTALGNAGTGGGDKLVLAAARRTSTGVTFDQPELVRGVALSSYGMAILINDGPDFDF